MVSTFTRFVDSDGTPSCFACHWENMTEVAWVIRGRTHVNGVPILKMFKNALWTVLRTIFWSKIHQIAGFCIYKFTFSGSDTPGLPQTPRCFGPRRQFLLGSRAFPLFLFCETTTGRWTCLITLVLLQLFAWAKLRSNELWRVCSVCLDLQRILIRALTEEGGGW